MQTFMIEYEKAALKFLKKQEKQQQIRIIKAINQLPKGTDIKRLKGCDLYRLRVGDYRILYKKHENILTIVIVNIDNRGDVYK